MKEVPTLQKNNHKIIFDEGMSPRQPDDVIFQILIKTLNVFVNGGSSVGALPMI